MKSAENWSKITKKYWKLCKNWPKIEKKTLEIIENLVKICWKWVGSVENWSKIKKQRWKIYNSSKIWKIYHGNWMKIWQTLIKSAHIDQKLR